MSGKSSTLAWAIQKFDILGGFPVKLPQKILGEKIVFAAQQPVNNFPQQLDFDVLWFRRRRAYKNLEEKKGKTKEKKPHRGQKWVGWDERVS